MTLSAYAEHRGCTRPAVARAIRDGRIEAEPDGRIDPIKADAQWAENSRPRASAQSPEGTAAAEAESAGVVGYAEARRRLAIAEAAMAERRNRLQAGELIEVAAVRSQLGLEFATLREGLLQLPARVAPELAAEADPAAVERLLRAEIHQALVRLAGAADALPTPGGGHG